MGTGQQRENRLLRHGKAGMHAGLPGPAPSLQRPVRKIPGLESRGTEKKTYTKSQNDAGKINRNDFDAELWMGGKHK